MVIHCKYDKLVNPSVLINHPKNRNKHGQDQIERLGLLYKSHGIRHPIIISNRSNVIVAGHGRKLAAIRAGIKEFPIVYQDFDSDAQEYAFLVSDNAIGLWADLDLDEINKDVDDLFPDLDLNLLAIQDFNLDDIDLSSDSDNENKDEAEDSSKSDDKQLYTKGIKAPIYEPKGEMPSIKELISSDKTNSLIQDIKKSELNSELKNFLIEAAKRHTVFDYGKIAEYYAHQPAEVKEFFEKSALVIIDFDKAIESGFVKLSEEIMETFANEER